MLQDVIERMMSQIVESHRSLFTVTEEPGISLKVSSRWKTSQPRFRPEVGHQFWWSWISTRPAEPILFSSLIKWPCLLRSLPDLRRWHADNERQTRQEDLFFAAPVNPKTCRSHFYWCRAVEELLVKQQVIEPYCTTSVDGSHLFMIYLNKKTKKITQ